MWSDAQVSTNRTRRVRHGNIRSKYCPTLIFNDVFVPWERVFMCGEVEFAAEMVIKFSSYHRQSHGGCKSGKIDCMTGAALAMMDYSGLKSQPSETEDHRYGAPGETLYGCSGGVYGKSSLRGLFIDTVLANASNSEGRDGKPPG
jgi:4-hydroxybutyryl-CoA dehydratase/vinylacetyl-CoA-Delta-isomerase